MTSRSISVDVPAEVQDMWPLYEDPQAWKMWAPQIVDVEYPLDVLSPGCSGTVRGPLGVKVPFTITEVVPPRWSWRVRVGPIRLTMTHDLQPRVGDGAVGGRALLTMHGPAPIVTAYAPLARHALRRLGWVGAARRDGTPGKRTPRI